VFRAKSKTPGGKSADSVYCPNSTTHTTRDLRNEARLDVSITETSYPSAAAKHEHSEPKRWYQHWKPWIFLLNIATLVAVAWYACITRNMWKEMQRQTVIQRRTGINSERAWVGLDVPITLDAIQIQSAKVRINGHYSIKNFGHGPALKVVQSGSFVTDFSNLEIETREANLFCESGVRFATGMVPIVGSKQPGPFGLTLFTGKDHIESIDFAGPAETAAHLRFIGCVAYLDQFKTVHWTQFCMERPVGDATPRNKIPKLEFCAMFNETDQPQD